MWFKKYQNLFVALVLFFSFSSCVHTRNFSDNPQDYKTEIENQSTKNIAVINFKTGTMQNARSLHFIKDSLTYIAYDNNIQNFASLSQINSIQFKNKAQGAMEGLGLGFLAGAGLGTILGLASGDDRAGFTSLSAETKAGAFAVVGGILGALLGLPTGYGSGSTTVYKFQNYPSKSSSKTVIVKQK